MMFLPYPIVMLLSLVTLAQSAGVNLLTDGDFEDANVTKSWSCNGCTLTQVDDHHGGRHSVLVDHRGHSYSGPGQTFAATAGNMYFFRGFIKLLNTSPGMLYHQVNFIVDLGMDGSGKHVTDTVGNAPKIPPGVWSEVGGDYLMPSFVKGHVRIYLTLNHTDVRYLVDDFTVGEITPPASFKADANARIDKLRKQDIYLQLEDGVSPSGLTVELSQTSSSFPIGTAVKAKYIVDPAQKKYQDFFYANFNWAVLENALKWLMMEPTQGHIDYETPEKAIDSLRFNGIKVRGHNIFWGAARHTPSWVVSLSNSDLRKAMEARIQGVVGRFKGKLEHWDVNNENIHLDWYEQKFHDPNITNWMFNETHKVNPQVKLFLNDYSVVSSRISTVALLNQANMLKAAGVPLYGLGVQCHLRGVSVSLMKHRLDELARAGLPIWVTELDISIEDEEKKAQAYDDALRLFFSHPAVEGIMFWGFWDKAQSHPLAALVKGDNLTLTPAGKRFQALVHQEWRTHLVQELHGDQVHVRGFKGDYSIKVLHGGQVIKQENLTVSDTPLHVRIPLRGTGSDPHVTNIIVG